jgi:chromosome segregation ATPase
MLRLMKNKEAQEAFLKATTRPGTPYLPAWEALIWTDFVGKNYAVGYDHLLKFATLVQSSKDLSPEARDDAIDWIGRSMAALELTIESNKDRETWLRTDKKLTDLLDEDATEDYIRGKEEVNARHASLEDDIQHAKEKAKKQHADQLEKKQNRIDKSLEAVKEKRENLKKSAEEMKETLAEQTAAYQKQMTRLEKDFGFFDRRSAVLITTMAALDQEAAVLQQRKKNSNNQQGNNNIDLAIVQLQNQRMVSNAEFLKTTAAADEIAANARRLNQERSDFLDQYQKATGEIVEADAGAEKWKERTLNQAKSLKKAKETAKPPVPVAKIQVAKTYRTYVDLDLFAERTKLMTSFGITAIAK